MKEITELKLKMEWKTLVKGENIHGLNEDRHEKKKDDTEISRILETDKRQISSYSCNRTQILSTQNINLRFLSFTVGMLCSQDESLHSPTVTVLYWDSGSWPSVEVLFLVPFVVVAVIPDIAVSPILTVSVVPFLWNNVPLITYAASKCTTANVNKSHNLKLEVEDRLHKRWMCKKIQIQQGLEAVCIIQHKKPNIEKDERQVKIINEYIYKRKGLRVCQLHCCLQL